MGDFNFDSAVNVSDLGVLASNYCTSKTSSTATVPEPAMLTSLLLLLAATTLPRLSRRHQ